MYKYVNAYFVTRHYGGPEEGGWWYDCGEPVASLPVKAEYRSGCAPGICMQCDAARRGDGEFCKEESDYVEDGFFEWLNYSWKGTQEARLALIDAWRLRFVKDSADLLLEKTGFFDSAEYKRNLRTVRHLAVSNEEEVIRAKKMIRDVLGEEEYGNIGSVNGGMELSIVVEGHIASFWPEEKPRYE